MANDYFIIFIHKKWFKPNEASALRNKTWNKLVELFRESNQTD
ncbi:unnamed protein product [Brassica napus]|uniref:(rape) hypothetical protein n=1 Tax=Brassica napus TaxID=3708 RepID=A0A816S672_BRANA|nr:unnamed protein product [Brassica napus]